MAIGDTRVIVWPFSYTGNLVFADDAAGTTKTTQGLSTPTNGFVVHEVGGAMPSGITNLVVELRLMLQTAYNAVYGSGGNFTLSLRDDGRVLCTNNAVSSLWVLPGDASFTADESVIGLSSAAFEFPPSSTVTPPYQWGGQWFPDRPHVDDTGERARHVLVTSPPTLTGVQSVVCHSDLANPAYYRTIEWDDVYHARMFQSAADDATAAAMAGTTQNDPNVAFVNLVRYWADNSQPLPQRVYVRDTVTTTTLGGPYQLAMPNAAVEDGGVARAWQRSDLGQRRFRVALEFVREGG